MRARIVRIGNSKGIRIPKAVLEHCRFREEVELEIRNGRLIIQASHKPREGWKKAFEVMAERGEDAPLNPPTPTQWDRSEWEW